MSYAVRGAMLPLLLGVLVCLSAPFQASAQEPRIRLAQAGSSDISEKEAFEAAKELGTIDAWEAFLENFPKGFRADLARAYVRRLGTQPSSAAPAPAQKPAPAVQRPAPAAPPPPPAAPSLQTVDLGPGTKPWYTGTHVMDEGNGTAAAAVVQGRGVRMTAFCTPRRTVPILLISEPRGVYPDFDERVKQGLAAAGAGPHGNGSATVPMRFVNGQQYFVRAHVEGMTGDLVLGDGPDGFSSASPVIEALMAGQTVIVSAPPFSATFQLNGSRDAICSMLKRCGAAAAQSGCAAPAPKPVSRKLAPRRTGSGCPRGTVRFEGRCLAPSQLRSFCGPGFHPQGSRCVSNAAQTPAPRRCPPGKVLEFGTCVEDD